MEANLWSMLYGPFIFRCYQVENQAVIGVLADRYGCDLMLLFVLLFWFLDFVTTCSSLALWWV